jgi:hypothetical protein
LPVGVALALYALSGALDLLYSVYLRPNLGLSQEPDWVAEHPGFQWGQRQANAAHVWNKPVAPPFGPTMETVLSIAGNGRAALLDLDTGKQLSRDAFDEDDTNAAGWAQSEKLDLAVLSKNGRSSVLALGMATGWVPRQNSWESVSAQQVADYWLFERRQPKPAVTLPLTTNLTGLFVFWTREGGTGLLQFLGRTDNPPGVKVRYKLIGPVPPAPSSPREVVAEWLRRVKAGRTQEAWDLTTRSSGAGWSPSLTDLWEFDRIHPIHQLGNEEQVMVVSNPFGDNSGQTNVFYAVLQKTNGQWRIDRQSLTSRQNAAGLVAGFKIHPGVKYDVRADELIGEWSTPCLSLTLAADGTGIHIQTGPGPAQQPEPIKWEVSGSTLLTRWGDRDVRWEILRVDDDSFQVDYQPGGVSGEYWTWYRSKAVPSR